MRFLADMGVSLRVVEWLRSRRHDVVHLRERGLQRLSDAAIFEKATAEGRVVLTFDLDFGEIVALSGGATTSVIVFRLRNARAGNVIARLERVLSESEDALRSGAVVIVEDGRHRVRLLPVGGAPQGSAPGEVRELSSSERPESAATIARYVGIDYSGAKTPIASLSGLRIYLADSAGPPCEVLPRKNYWTRRGVAEWLVERLREDAPTLVGIDHGFSFPLQYFERHGLAHDWPGFLEDFQRHWPTDEDHVSVDSVRHGSYGNGTARTGSARWRRLTELRSGSAKSVFHFDVPGSVAKSTHAGLPWLLYLRRQLGQRVHFWPFDGWAIPAGRSAIVEVYPALWRKTLPRDRRNDDQHDAYAASEWMRRADRDGSLAKFLRPFLAPGERTLAELEGWILGVT